MAFPQHNPLKKMKKKMCGMVGSERGLDSGKISKWILFFAILVGVDDPAFLIY